MVRILTFGFSIIIILSGAFVLIIIPKPFFKSAFFKSLRVAFKSVIFLFQNEFFFNSKLIDSFSSRICFVFFKTRRTLSGIFAKNKK